MFSMVTISASNIITICSVITGIIAVGGIIFSIYRWYLKQNKQDNDIKKMNEELCVITYGLLACLKGLKEQGCNGPVTEATERLEKHINKKAHDQE